VTGVVGRRYALHTEPSHLYTAPGAMSRKRPIEDTNLALTQTEPKRQQSGDVGLESDKSSAACYTVGWICAVHTEYVAAQAFLDKRHDRPEEVSRHNNNDYTLGTIGKHNVVIAVLPNGEYSTTSAAGVARDMLHSFPNIRIGLMVRIGGGAPSSKHNIQLGDIIISAPRNRKASVFQYDFGKTIQDQSFLTTSVLDQPPTVLRTAVSGLQAQYESEGSQIKESIDKLLENKPKLQRKYGRPSQDSNSLYLSSIIHTPGDEGNCTSTCGVSQSELVI
jgi:hypothetical protein